MLGAAIGTLVLNSSSAGAVQNTCRARNLTRGTQGLADLQAAIDTAHSGDRISVKGVCVGSFTIDKNLTLVGHQTGDGAQPVLHGRGGSDRVVDVFARVTLTNLKITGGVNMAWDPDVGDSHAGGGIRVREGGTLTLNRSVVRGNRSGSGGGGIANYGKLILNGSSAVNRNEAGPGGGIANYGVLRMNGSSSVRGNTGTYGGGITLMGGSTLRMNGSSLVRGNTSLIGGGIYADDHSGRHLPDPTIDMNDSSSVLENTAREGGGISLGGISLEGGGTLTMNDSSSVLGNTAREGGGISLGYGSALTMNDSSSVRGNHATDDGGGIWRSYGTVTLNDASSVRGNSADHGEDDIAMPPEIDKGIHLSEIPAEAFAAMAILILGAIAAATLIARPMLRTTVIATMTGMIGMFFFGATLGRWATGPGETLIALAQGWSVGVTVGALLGAVVLWVRGKWWSSEGDVVSIIPLALVVWIVLAIPALVLCGVLWELLSRII